MSSARQVAVEALGRIDEGAYANLVLPALLARSGLAGRDRDFVTELVYGVTRQRRALDSLIDRHLHRDVEPVVRNVLRTGAYQAVFLRTPPHAAVGETVTITPKRAKGMVNAVMRRVAATPPSWPDRPTELSYPDWVVDRLAADLGAGVADAALVAMNEAPSATVRPDGYVQDLASQWVAAAVDAEDGDRVADLCAAPGGKATALAATGARVAAVDVNEVRAGLVAANARRLGYSALVGAVVGDGRRPPLQPGAFDRVLVDAPCSGLGVLRRRPDARWRIQPTDVDDLAALQRDLLTAAIPLARAGGVLIYSVCTLTAAETTGIDDWLAATYPHLTPLAPPVAPWTEHRRGALLLPQAAGTDGMFLLRLRVP